MKLRLSQKTLVWMSRPVSDAANVQLNTISVDGYEAIVENDTISITFDEDARIGNPFSLLNFNNLLTEEYAINVTQPLGGIDDHFLPETVNVSLTIAGQEVGLTNGYNLLNLVSGSEPGALETKEDISSLFFLTPELAESITETDFSIAGLTEEGTFTANENIKVTLDNEHPFINANHNLGGQLPHQVSAQIVVLGHVVAETQLTQDFELGNVFEFDYNALMESILSIVDINLEDLTVTEAAINDALASDASLNILSMDELGEVLNAQEYALSLEQGVNTITPLTGASETFLDAVVGENASGALNFQLNVSSSDHGETPVESTYNIEIGVNRIADQTTVFGLFYENLTVDGLDVISLYHHPDQDGSESLTVDLFVDEAETPITNEADVTSNNFVNALTPTASTTLAATLTAREDVEGFGDVKEGFEESIDDSSTGNIIYVDDPSISDYMGSSGNDLFASSYGTLHFDGGEGVDKIDLSLLELDDEADSLSVVVSIADGVISGGLSYSLTSSTYSQGDDLSSSTPSIDEIDYVNIGTGSGSYPLSLEVFQQLLELCH